jgi:hypothetical protein
LENACDQPTDPTKRSVVTRSPPHGPTNVQGPMKRSTAESFDSSQRWWSPLSACVRTYCDFSRWITSALLPSMHKLMLATMSAPLTSVQASGLLLGSQCMELNKKKNFHSYCSTHMLHVLEVVALQHKVHIPDQDDWSKIICIFAS